MAYSRASTYVSTRDRTRLEAVEITQITGRCTGRAASLDESEVRFSLRGEFDISNKQRLSETLAPYMAAQRLTVDLSHLTFIDASTLSVFINVARCRRELGAARLRLVNGSPHFRRILWLCGLDDIFDIRDVVPRTAKPPSFIARSLAFTALP